MISVNLISALWGALGAILIFVLRWAGKHALDRLLLPRVLDWWVRQNQQRALRRAEKLLIIFKQDLQYGSDLRHLILRVESRNMFLIVY